MPVQNIYKVPDSTVFVDIRSSAERRKIVLSNPIFLGSILLVLGIGTLVIPFMVEPFFLVGIYLALKHGPLKVMDLPMSVPSWLKKLDKSQPLPENSAEYELGNGILYFGNVRSSVRDGNNEQVWSGDSDLRTHVIIFGTTGSGKTEALLSMAFNSIVWGGGFLICDGKGTPKLFTQIYALARYLGREDDVRLLNFMLGSFNPRIRTPIKITNTLAFMNSGTASFMNETLVSLMPDSGSDGAMWKDRATIFSSSVCMAMEFLRDHNVFSLTPGVFRDHTDFPVVFILATHNEELRKNSTSKLCARYKMPIPAFPQTVEDGLMAYLKSLAGFVLKNGVDQQPKTLEQHGYLQMQFTKMLGMLTDVYGHIFNADISDIDLFDVVMNNRILCILLPSLEKSDHETRSLGNLSLRLTKGMMSTVMGSEVEGHYKDTIETLPTAARYPYIVFLDEVGYYIVANTAIIAAQGRSLGISCFFAGQDKPGMVRGAGEEEIASILGNTKIKIFMSIEDSNTTWEEAKLAAGEEYVAISSGKERESGIFSPRYKFSTDVRFEKQPKITLQELKAQGKGEAVILWKDRVIRCRIMYSNIKPSFVQVNTLLQIEKPKIHELIENKAETQRLIKARDDLKLRLLKAAQAVSSAKVNIENINSDWITFWQTYIAKYQSHPRFTTRNRTDIEIAALTLALQKLTPPPSARENSAGETNIDSIEDATLNEPFDSSAEEELEGSNEMEEMVPTLTLEKLKQVQFPNMISDSIEKIEIALGKSIEEAQGIAKETSIKVNQSLVPILLEMPQLIEANDAEQIAEIFESFNREIEQAAKLPYA